MSKKILVISSSFRQGSNSDMMADRFIEGAAEAGCDTEKVTLYDKGIAFCEGCVACQNIGHCIIEDDAVEIVEKMLHADVIVFAAPVYYYSIPGQLKTMLDRANPLFSLDYQFRQIYFLTCAAENEEYTPSGAKTAIQGWVDCFEQAEFCGTVFAGGVTAPGDIEGHPALLQAYELGKSLG